MCCKFLGVTFVCNIHVKLVNKSCKMSEFFTGDIANCVKMVYFSFLKSFFSPNTTESMERLLLEVQTEAVQAI